MNVDASKLSDARERAVAALTSLQTDGFFPLTECAERPPATPTDQLFSTASTLLACGEWLPRSAVEANSSTL